MDTYILQASIFGANSRNRQKSSAFRVFTGYNAFYDVAELNFVIISVSHIDHLKEWLKPEYLQFSPDQLFEIFCIIIVLYGNREMMVVKIEDLFAGEKIRLLVERYSHVFDLSKLLFVKNIDMFFICENFEALFKMEKVKKYTIDTKCLDDIIAELRPCEFKVVEFADVVDSMFNIKDDTGDEYETETSCFEES